MTPKKLNPPSEADLTVFQNALKIKDKKKWDFNKALDEAINQAEIDGDLEIRQRGTHKRRLMRFIQLAGQILVPPDPVATAV
jgi:hypothetical protein